LGYLSVQTAGAHVAPVAGGLRILSLEIYGFQGAVSIFYVGSLSYRIIDAGSVKAEDYSVEGKVISAVHVSSQPDGTGEEKSGR